MSKTPVAKDVHSLRLSEPQTDIARRLAELTGQSFGGILTRACEIGLAELEVRHYEADNKRLLNRKLRQRDGRLLGVLESLEGAGDLPPQVAEAIAILKQGLTD